MSRHSTRTFTMSVPSALNWSRAKLRGPSPSVSSWVESSIMVCCVRVALAVAGATRRAASAARTATRRNVTAPWLRGWSGRTSRRAPCRRRGRWRPSAPAGLPEPNRVRHLDRIAVVHPVTSLLALQLHDLVRAVRRETDLAPEEVAAPGPLEYERKHVGGGG